MARKPRSSQIDLDRSHLYHVVSRCARQLHLLGGTDLRGSAERKDLLLQELERLAGQMAVGVAGFAIMDNHVHLLLRAEPDMAQGWSDDEVARRWLSLHPPRNGYHHRLEVTQEAIDSLVANAESVASARAKLGSISQFMKEFKQEVAQKINQLDEVVGPVWAGRFKCNAVTNDPQLMATLAYIDLNPFAAGVGDGPEDADHTSLGCRLGYCPEAQPQEHNGSEERSETPSGMETSRRMEKAAAERPGWWLPITSSVASRRTDQRPLWGEGVRVTWGNYLKLLDTTARMLRVGKRHLDLSEPPIRVRLGGLAVRSISDQVCGWINHGLPWAGRSQNILSPP